LVTGTPRLIGNDKNIESFALEVFSGALRSTIGGSDVLSTIHQRDELGAEVRSTAHKWLLSRVRTVNSFEIKGITDQNGYINDMGRAKQTVALANNDLAANAERDARRAEPHLPRFSRRVRLKRGSRNLPPRQ